MNIYILILLSLFYMLACNIETLKDDNLKPEDFLLDVNNYSGNKLLLCAGNPSPKTFKERQGYDYHRFGVQDNNHWYTVDSDPLMRPNHVGNLFLPETYKYLSQKKFNIILDEYCVAHVSWQAAQHASELLQSGGIFISKYRGNFADLNVVKNEFIETGMSEVIFFPDPDKYIYSFKHKTADEIISECKKNHYEKPSDDGWYNFVAIKK